MGQINTESWPDRQVLITQKQVVTRLGRCGLQTTNRAVSSLEHGAGVDVAKLPELALALDCTITYLIGLTDDPHRWEPDPPHGRQSGRPAPDSPAVQAVVPAAAGAGRQPDRAAGLAEPVRQLQVGAGRLHHGLRALTGMRRRGGADTGLLAVAASARLVPGGGGPPARGVGAHGQPLGTRPDPTAAA